MRPRVPNSQADAHQLAASAAQTFLLLAVPRVRWLSLGSFPGLLSGWQSQSPPFPLS